MTTSLDAAAALDGELPPTTSVRVRNLGLKFYRNPNQAFTFQGIYRTVFEKKYVLEQTPADSLYRWIFRNLTFDIKNGELLAIMGPNGEGKTTLLRVLAGLLAADEGDVLARYRPYLLSAGLGFRDELNGYENIRLGGLFLGIPLSTLREKIQEIADFAELSDEALQKPTKYYSDGMRARLVFAVATCSHQKILFLDEILGAGDVGFQKKAQRRMEEIMKQAQSIVLVSHQSRFVLETASRAMLLYQGRMQALGDPKPIIEEYERVCSH